MGRREQTANHFGKLVRDERMQRDWSQAQMAARLSASGIPRIHPTTIAKIEAGDRPTRIDEAIGIADLFGVSLDKLLGRDIGPQQDLAYTLQALMQAAQQMAPLVSSLESRLAERVAELRAFPEFDERDAITAECERAAAALSQAGAAFAKLWWPLRDAMLVATTADFIRGQIAEMGDDGAET